jgi:hypothetical protein
MTDRSIYVTVILVKRCVQNYKCLWCRLEYCVHILHKRTRHTDIILYVFVSSNNSFVLVKFSDQLNFH